MEPSTKGFFQPTLQTIIAIPDHALKERIDQRNQNQRGNRLGSAFWHVLAIPPEIIAGMAAAKVSRKKQRIRL